MLLPCKISSKYLKAKFPEIKIGGYGSCGFYAHFRPDANDFYKSFLTWFDDFLDMCKKETYPELRASWKELTLDKRLSNKYFADSMYQKLRSMSKNEDCQDIMARCEHNRWNVQQLLLGFSPADEKKLEEFAKLNAALDDDAREQRSNWREKIGWNRMEPLQQKRAKEDREYKLLPHGQYDEKKNELKHGPRHIHPNIVHYDLLNVYDSGAEGYDVALNNGIPTILELVDGYHCGVQ